MIHNALDLVHAAAEPMAYQGLEIYQDLCRGLLQLKLPQFCFDDTSVSDGDVYVNLAVDRLKPEVIVVRVFHIQGQRIPILFRSEVRGSDLYISGYSKTKPIPAHFHVGNMRRFRDVNELGVAVQRAAVHHYKKLLDHAHAEAAAEPNKGMGLDAYEELYRAIYNCTDHKFRIGSTAINDGTNYAPLYVDNVHMLAVRVVALHRYGLDLVMRFRCYNLDGVLYLVDDLIHSNHVRYRVGSLNQFRTADELGVAIQRAALHYYPQVLKAHQAQAAAETPSDSDVQPGDSFRERALVLFPSYRPASVSYGKHKLLVRSRHHTSDGHLMVFADNCPEYSLAFEMDYLHDKNEYLHGEYVVHVQLRHHNRFNSYDVRILATVPENRFSHCVTPAALLQRALSVEWEGKKVIDALLAAVATSTKHAQAATEPLSSSEKPKTAYFGSWLRLFPQAAGTVRVQDVNLHVRYVNNVYSHLEVQYQRSPWALLFYSENDTEFRIRVMLNRKRFGHTLDSKTLTLVRDQVIDGCETREQVLKTVLGIKAQGKTVLQHLIDAASELVKVDA